MSVALGLSLNRPSVCLVTILCQFLLVAVCCRLCALRLSGFNSHHLSPGFLDFGRLASVVRCLETEVAPCWLQYSRIWQFKLNYCFFFLDWTKSCHLLWGSLLLVDWTCLVESETFVFLKKTVLVQGLKLILGRLLERFGPLGNYNDDLSVTLCVLSRSGGFVPGSQGKWKDGPCFRAIWFNHMPSANLSLYRQYMLTTPIKKNDRQYKNIYTLPNQ